MSEQEFRTEKDSIGTKNVPEDVYYDNVVASVSIPPDAGTNDALTYTCTDGKSLIRTIYVAETPQGNGRDNNVCLVVGGTYAGSTHY